jgi:Ig domain of plant-specific actin-binding protein
VATSDITIAEKAFRSTLGRKLLIASIAKAANVKPKAVVIGTLRKAIGYDQGFVMPLSFPVKGKRVYENVVYLRLDRVGVFMFEVALRPITQGATGTYVAALAGHIGTELAPIALTPPTVTGTAQQGQTLTATPGTWSALDATLTYQWERCDATGANCVAVVGATAQTYAVTAADVGATLVVVVTAANRFSVPTAASVATVAVI